MKYRVLFVISLLMIVLNTQGFGDVQRVNVYVGETISLPALAFGHLADDLKDEVEWTKSNSLVIITSDGMMTARTEGDVAVTYKSKDNSSNLSGTLLLTVKPKRSHGNLLTYDVYVGETIALSAKIFENSGEELDGSVKWASSNATIATVKDGIITAKKRGNAIITYTSNEGASIHSGSVYVNVKPTVLSVNLSVPKKTIQVGELMESQIKITPIPNLPVDAYDKVLYSSSNTSILKVDDNGIITGVNEGSALVKVETVDGSRTSSVKIDVESVVRAIQINDIPSYIYVGEELPLSVRVFPEEALMKDVTWKSTQQASVDKEGVLTGKSEGTAYISATSIDGLKKDTVSIQILSMVKSLELSESQVNIDDSNNGFQLEATLIPKTPGKIPLDGKIKWKSSNTGVATVNSNGLVTGKKDGIAVITATSNDGNRTDSVIVNVDLMDTFKITPSFLGLGEHPNRIRSGESIVIPYELLPLDITEDTLKIQLFGGDGTYTRSDNFIEIICYDEGRYTLKLSTSNGLEATTSFDVATNLSGVEINPKSLVKATKSNRYTLYLGQSATLDYNLIKSNKAPDILVNDVKWSSSTSDVASINNKGEINAKRIGVTNIKVETKDSNHFDYIALEVVGAAKTIDLPSRADIGLNMPYTPAAQFTAKEDLAYGLKDVMDTSYKLKILSIGVPREFIEGEIEFEEDRHKSISTLIDNEKRKNSSKDLTELSNELSASIKRKSALISLLRTSVQKRHKNLDLDYFNYVEVMDSDFTLTDRNFSKITVAKLINSSQSVQANLICRIVLEMTSTDGELKDTMSVYADGNTTELRLFDERGKQLKIDSYINDSALKQQTTLASQVDNTLLREARMKAYDSLAEANRPHKDVVISVYDANELGLVQDAFKSNYRRGITRLEMAKLCNDIYDLKMGTEPGNYVYSVFKDTSDQDAIRAFQFGIVSVSLDRTFRPDQIISREEMTHMLFRTIIAMEKDIDPTLSPERKTYFEDENTIQADYKQAVGYMSYDHSVIDGITDDMFWPQAQVQVDYALHYALKMMNVLK